MSPKACEIVQIVREKSFRGLCRRYFLVLWVGPVSVLLSVCVTVNVNFPQDGHSNMMFAVYINFVVFYNTNQG